MIRWGFGGYGRYYPFLNALSNYLLYCYGLTYIASDNRLGHREQKDEWAPRLVDVFTRHNVLPPGAIVSAGSANSACTAGKVYNY